eukprot:SAG22_NODE_6899_length_797_cov_1.335244_1_plen_48_part_10
MSWIAGASNFLDKLDSGAAQVKEDGVLDNLDSVGGLAKATDGRAKSFG